MSIQTVTMKRLVLGCVLFGILIISGSLQVIFSPFVIVRALMLFSVIVCSIGLGAFIRELFVQRNNISKNSTKN
ncbi:hypothetical protein [Bacillus massiliigorillae]|uniref:hypothetical protein n=1 Tax=Bacillus massiliigorillae TaxID=1243664 RepID=UPI0005A6EDDE|nr:hypothetical protein [Bacillus massiliigorillae]